MSVPDCPSCARFQARDAEREAYILILEGRLRDLEDKLAPPAPPKDHEPQPPAPAKKKTGRKPGGQPGHKHHKRVLVPAARVKHFVRFVPEHCECCRARLPEEPSPQDPPPTRHQYAELPEIAAEVTEYQGHYRTCVKCHTLNHQPIPAAATEYSKGPRLTGTLSYLAGAHGISKRGVEEIAEVVFDIPICLGSVAKMEQEVSAALVPAHQEAQQVLADAEVKHVDETGWKEAGKKRWLWVAATATIAVFLIHPKRNLQALQMLVGKEMSGILCSDRWRVYDWWAAMRRQVCWAHLKRNFEKKAEQGGEVGRIAHGCLEVQRCVFELWHLFRNGKCSRDELCEHAASLMMKLHEYLDAGVECSDAKFVRFCRRIRAVEASLWTFLVIEGVDPTNNHAERVLRLAVLWRRKSFGCHSPAGCRFVERILTTVQSLKLQKRPSLEFIVQSVQALRNGTKPPSLLQAA